MPKINLLPWREMQREARKREFYSGMIGASLLACFAVLLMHVMMSYRIDAQQGRNAYLSHEITLLNKKIDEIKDLKKMKAVLIARMAIIQQLQVNRTQVVQLFEDLVHVLPKGVHLSKVVRKNNEITIAGYAVSNTNISALMRNIENSQAMLKPMLSQIKKEGESHTSSNEFTLQSRVKMMNDVRAIETGQVQRATK